MTRLLRVVLIVLLPLLAFGVTRPDEKKQIHECKDALGNVVYQDEPCIEPVPVAVPKVKPKSPPKSPPQPWIRVPSSPRRAEPATPRRRFAETGPPPETTLRTFVGAVKAGDRGLAYSCLTAEAAAEFGPGADSIPLERLRLTVESFTAFVSEGEVGPFWSIRALRKGTGPKWILFERTPRGEWKIVGI